MSRSVPIRIALAAVTTLAGAVAHAYDVAPAADAGVIRGTVKLKGKAPKPQPVKLPARLNKADAEFCAKQQLVTEDTVVGPDGGLANVVVALEKIGRGKAPPVKEAELMNRNCRFVPRVSSLTVGTRLTLSNQDPFLHNTHLHWARDNATVWNLALPEKGAKVVRTVKKAGLMRVGCDAGHTWMAAFIAAFDHPYQAVTQPSGEFVLDGVPPGDYKVVFWHEKLGTRRVDVKVPAAGAVTANVTYP